MNGPALGLRKCFLSLLTISGLIVTPQVSAAPANVLSPIVQRAQKLLIQKQRAKATAFLQNTLAEGNWSLAQKKELREQIAAAAGMFLTDKGQRLFQAAQSLIYENPDMALRRLNEALEQEGPNVQILQSTARVYLEKDDCGLAVKSTSEANKQNKFDDRTGLLAAQSLICEERYADADKQLSAISKIAAKKDPVFHLAKGIVAFHRQDLETANKEFNLAAATNSGLPEVDYWIWKSAQERNPGSRSEAAERYVAACKNITTKQKRRFQNQPKLCSRIKEVENALQASAPKPGDS